MPSALLDVICALALVVLLAVAFAHPPARVEAAAGLVAVCVLAGLGAVGRRQALVETRHLIPVVAFLAAILVVAEICAAEGVFRAVGSLVTRVGRRSPLRMFTLALVAAAVITAALSLDATVVLLTPVVAVAATTSMVSARPMVFACVRMANSASLLLPVSNLTNLLALPRLHVAFLQFALLMAPVWLVVIGVEYLGHRLFFAGDLRSAARPAPIANGQERLPVVPLVVVVLMLAGFTVASPFGIAPAWVAAATAVVLSTYSVARRRIGLRTVVASTHLSFAVFVLCLGVVVAALSDSFLGRWIADVVPSGRGLLSLLAVAVLATLLANVVNNLPATLLLVPLVAPLGVTALLAALIGLNVGSGLTYTGSLANLLWRRSVRERGGSVSARDFHLLSALVTPPTLAAAVVTLWAWSLACRSLGWA